MLVLTCMEDPGTGRFVIRGTVNGRPMNPGVGSSTKDWYDLQSKIIYPKAAASRWLLIAIHTTLLSVPSSSAYNEANNHLAN